MRKEPGLTDALIIICSPLIVAFLIVAQLLITGVDRVMRKLWERV